MELMLTGPVPQRMPIGRKGGPAISSLSLRTSFEIGAKHSMQHEKRSMHCAKGGVPHTFLCSYKAGKLWQQACIDPQLSAVRLLGHRSQKHSCRGPGSGLGLSPKSASDRLLVLSNVTGVRQPQETPGVIVTAACWFFPEGAAPRFM